jgi:hypothetical protein
MFGSKVKKYLGYFLKLRDFGLGCILWDVSAEFFTVDKKEGEDWAFIISEFS